MRIQNILFILILILFGCSKDGPYTQNGSKPTGVPGVYIDFQETGTYINGEKNGPYIFEYLYKNINYNGKNFVEKLNEREEGTYRDGKKYGPFKVIQISSEGTETISYGYYANDKKHGPFVQNYHDGTRQEYEYINGIKEGRYTYFKKNGEILMEGTYKNGRPIVDLQYR